MSTMTSVDTMGLGNFNRYSIDALVVFVVKLAPVEKDAFISGDGLFVEFLRTFHLVFKLASKLNLGA